MRRPALFPFLAVLLAAGFAGHAGDRDHTLALAEALDRAARGSEAARLGELDLRAAREETARARALYRPSATLDLSHTNLDHDPFFVFGPSAFPAGEQVFWKYQFAVREVLWDGGRRRAALGASRSGEAAAEAGRSDAVVQAQLATLGAYLEVVALGERRAVVERRLKALEDHRRVARALFEEGVVARNDLLRTEVALRTVADQGSDLENRRALAAETLARAMGEDPDPGTALPERLPGVPALPWDAPVCQARAAERNAGLRALSRRLAAQEELVALRRRDAYPTAVVQAFHSYEQNRYLLYPHVTGVFVGLSWNFYDGGARAAKVREAQAEAEKTRVRLEDARRAVRIAVDQAWRDYQQALREAATALTNEEAAAENLRILEDQYREGLVRTTDVLDAESVLADSRFASASQKYRAYQRQGALLALLGEDLAAFYAGLPADAGTEP